MNLLAQSKPRHLIFAFLLCAATSLSCEQPKVGQSGSEDLPTPPNSGASTVPCPCVWEWRGRSALRVTVLSRDGATVRLRVEDVVGGVSTLHPGDVIEGQQFDETFACYRGCSSVDVGDQAFAFYRPRPDAEPKSACEARSSCVEACREDTEADEDRRTFGCMCREQAAPQDDRFESPTCGGRLGEIPEACRAQCEVTTAAACAGDDTIVSTGEVALSPWADPIVFAQRGSREIRVPIADLGELFPAQDRDAEALARCRERFGDWNELF